MIKRDVLWPFALELKTRGKFIVSTNSLVSLEYLRIFHYLLPYWLLGWCWFCSLLYHLVSSCQSRCPVQSHLSESCITIFHSVAFSFLLGRCCFIMSCLISTCAILCWSLPSCSVLSHPVPSCLILLHLTTSCSVWFHLVMFCPFFYHPLPSCLVLSILVSPSPILLRSILSCSTCSIVSGSVWSCFILSCSVSACSDLASLVPPVPSCLVHSRLALSTRIFVK